MRFTRKFILASASPRRRELLNQVGFDFSIVPADISEFVDPSCPPGAIVESIARDKARAIAEANPNCIVLGADTIVVLDDDILGKPLDAADAEHMLGRLSGRTHQVFTGISLQIWDEQLDLVSHESTLVTMDVLSEALIRKYVDTGSPMDKAGSYGIQDMGAFYISKIDGDFYTVMGLPLNGLFRLLNQSLSSYITEERPTGVIDA